MVRRLVEQDEVAFIFATIGTPTNTAIARYTNSKGVPLIFLGSGANKWGDFKNAPWVMGWQPSYRTEAQIYTRYALEQKPDCKIAILYQNDDFGKDYPAGVKDALGADFDKRVVKVVSYEVTDATINSQAVALQASGADVLITAATPKFAAQTIRKIADLGWKPMHFMTNVSISVGSVIAPAGKQNAIGMITAALSEGPDGRDLEERRRHESMACIHGEIYAGCRPYRCRAGLWLWRHDVPVAGAEAVRDRLLPRQHHEAGGKSPRCRTPRAAAWHQGQHQPDQLPPDPADAAFALDG